MDSEDSQDKIEKMKQVEGGPGVDDVLEVYSSNSGFSGQRFRSEGQFAGPTQKSSYSNSSG